jgi:hypothetical protein
MDRLAHWTATVEDEGGFYDEDSDCFVWPEPQSRRESDGRARDEQGSAPRPWSPLRAALEALSAGFGVDLGGEDDR